MGCGAAAAPQPTHYTATVSALMGWRFRKRKKLLPGVTLNLGKRSASISAGPRGAKLNAGSRGVGATLTLLGTGLAYVWRKRR